ncbi:MAG: alpha/beta hydrolase [Candidatus Hodarchaeota archaeon]
MLVRVLYLYGFASGPLSTKAQFFRKKFPINVDFEIYDYNPDQESFTNMKSSSLLEDLHIYLEKYYSKGVILFGSSFGGLLSLWYASQHPNNVNKLILMAPTLRFSASIIAKFFDPSDWKKEGFANILHFRYNKMVPLAYSFYQDILDNPPPDFYSLDLTIPTLIFHGKFDDIVPIIWSKEYAKANQYVILRELEDDHQFTKEKEEIWRSTKKFLGL